VGLYKIFAVFIFTCLYVSLNAQPLPKKRTLAQSGYFEYQTSYREKLIYLDTMIIDQVVLTLRNEGCLNLKYFRQPFHKDVDLTRYPIGFNFAKFSSGFGSTLKQEICKALVENKMCIDQIVENTFAPGSCSRDPRDCYPVIRLIFLDKDPMVLSLVKKRISTKGYRIQYNQFYNTTPIDDKFTNERWISLFTAEELELIDKEQVSYLRSLSTKKN
jgi:hypothetical protein